MYFIDLEAINSSGDGNFPHKAMSSDFEEYGRYMQAYYNLIYSEDEENGKSTCRC